MLLFLAACTTPTHIELGGSSDTASGTLVGNDSADSLPAPPDQTLGSPAFSPDGGAFVGGAEVTLSVADGEGDLYACVADPSDSTCTMREYTVPIELGASGIVRAEVRLGAETSGVTARSFVEVSSSVAAFSSPIPILVFWTDESAPDSTRDVAMGLDVFEPPEGGEATLGGAPSDSGRARLHVRGSSSAGFDKHAYDLELWHADTDTDRGVPLLGMPKNGDWILYAPYYFDDALVRNPVAYDLSNSIGRYAPRTRFAEVFVGDRSRAVTDANYVGVYVVAEEIEVDADRVAITPLTDVDVAEPEVSGGYLIKIDRTGDGESGFYAGSGGGVWQFQQSFVNVEPIESALQRAQSKWLEAYLDSIGDALVSPDLTDPTTGLRYDELLDVDSFIDHHIVNVFMKNPDAFRLSGYMYKDRSGLLNAGPAWDFDRAAGSTDSRSTLPTWWDDQNETGDCTDVWEFGWYPGLFDDPAFADRYWARFAALLGAELSNEAVDTLIEGFAANLEEPASRNAARWGSAAFRPSIDALELWFHRRHDWMVDCIETYPDPRMCPG